MIHLILEEYTMSVLNLGQIYVFTKDYHDLKYTKLFETHPKLYDLIS